MASLRLSSVLQLLKSAQMQHGLRFGDYACYRRYCTARLRRLYKSLMFTRRCLKHTKRSISITTVTEVIRQSELCSKYRFSCCCKKCRAMPTTYIDHCLQIDLF